MPSTQVGISELNADVRLDLMTDALYKNVLSDILRDIDVFSRYADEEGIANILSGLNFSQFSCISANIQGLPNNNTEFINFMNKLNSKREKISCFSLQETWLKDSNLHLYSYNRHRINRPGLWHDFGVYGGMGNLCADHHNKELLPFYSKLY